jgi:hypothetical protein
MCKRLPHHRYLVSRYEVRQRCSGLQHVKLISPFFERGEPDFKEEARKFAYTVQIVELSLENCEICGNMYWVVKSKPIRHFYQYRFFEPLSTPTFTLRMKLKAHTKACPSLYYVSVIDV